MPNTKHRYFKVSNNKMVIHLQFNFKRLLTKSSQREAVNQRKNRKLPITRLSNTKNFVLKMILDHNQLKSLKCNITQWAATISAQCSTALINLLTKLIKTKTKMKIKKATRYPIKSLHPAILTNTLTKKSDRETLVSNNR